MPAAGLPQGCAFSPPLANLYLVDFDLRFPIVRYCDNFVAVSDYPELVLNRFVRQLGDIGLECHEIEFDPTTFCKSPLKSAG